MKLRCLSLSLLIVLFGMFALTASGQNVPLAGAHAVEIWDPGTRQRTLALNEEQPVFDIAFNPSGSMLAAAGADGLSLWDTNSGKRYWTRSGTVYSVVFSPDGRMLAGVTPKEILVWDLSGKETRIFSGHTDEKSAVVFSPDARILASASADHTIRVWNLATARELRTLGSDEPIYALAFSPDEQLVFGAGGGDKISAWSIESGEKVMEWTRPVRQINGTTQEGTVLALSVSPDGALLAAAGTDQVCTLYKLHLASRRAALVHVFGDSAYPVTTVRFTQLVAQGARRQALITAGFDRTVRIWDLSSYSTILSFQSTQGPISALAVTDRISGEASRIATATDFRELTTMRTLHVLAVGINEYKYLGPRFQLPWSVHDATAVSETFRRISGNLFGRVDTQMLLDSAATREAILERLHRIRETARSTDTFVFFFAGDNVASQGDAYLVPADAAASSPESVRDTCLSVEELNRLLNTIPAVHQLIILSTPLGTEVLRAANEEKSAEVSRYAGLLDRSVALFTIPTVRLPSPNEEIRLSSWIIDGLNGKARDRSGFITANSLVNYVREAMERSIQTQGEPIDNAAFLYGDDFVLEAPISPRPDRYRGAVSKTTHGSRASIRLASFRESRQSVAQDSRGFPRAQTPQATAAPLPPRHDYALVFAGTHFDHQARGQSWPDLKFPEKDAQAIADSLHNFFGFDAQVIPDPNFSVILAKLREYRQKSYGPEDQLFVMFAGHGDEDDVDGYIVARNSRPGDVTTELPYPYLRQILDNTPARHILLVLDSCYDGAFEPRSTPARSQSTSSRRAEGHLKMVVWTRDVGNSAYGETSSTIAETSSDDALETSDSDFVHNKLRYISRKYLVSAGREPVPDQSPFAAKMIETLRQSAARDEVLSATQLYSGMERLKPQPHEENFGRFEPWSDFLFVPKNRAH